MRYWLILLCVLSLRSVFAAEDSLPEKYRINGYEEFRDLSKEKALEKGEALAKSDFEAGIYRILVYGRRALNSPAETRLREQYSIYTVPIAGCIVSDGILSAAEGYNRTMKPLLEKKFGADIFADEK